MEAIQQGLELRMYSLVMYNLSGIQKGIQAYHATVEGARLAGKTNTDTRPELLFNKSEYDEWAEKWKTVIILSGGGSIQMEEHHSILIDKEIRHAIFQEPDLNNATSAISFIVDERVFNYDDYPLFPKFLERTVPSDYSKFLKKRKKDKTLQIEGYFSDLYREWSDIVGGDYNIFLKEWLPQFRLA